MRFAVLALLVGCGRVAFDAVTPPDAAEPLISVSVEPQAATIGKTWLRHATPGTDTPCATNKLWYSACDHAAEHLIVRIPDDKTDCATLTFGDELGAFDWSCSRTASELTFASLGLKRDAGLQTLIDPNGWKPNRFVARDSTGERFASDPEVWWDNPVVPLPDNSSGAAVVLADAQAIYVLDTRRSTRGYTIGADFIGIVILDGAALTWSAGGPNNCNGGLSICLLTTDARRQGIWIEGELDGGGAAGPASEFGVHFYDPYWLQLRHVYSHHHNGNGVALEFGMSLLHGYTGTDNDGHGVSGQNTFMTARHVVTANNGLDGVNSRSYGVHLLTDVKSYNNQGNGIAFVFDATGMFTDILVAHNGATGLYVDNAYEGGSFHGITAIGNGARGVDIRDLTGGTISRILSVNNATDGFYFAASQVSELSQLVVANNGSFGLSFDTIFNGLVLGNVLVGNNVSGNCNVVNSTNPGIDNTCASTATLVTGVDLLASFVGGIQASSVTSIADWRLPEREQAWGRDAAAFGVGSRSRCMTATCRAWDYSLAASDPWLRDANEPFVAGAACPASVAGDIELSAANEVCQGTMNGYPQVACPRTLLVNAMESLDDHVGNDDGYCESNEYCDYLPHLSTFRGRGAALAPCVFEDGMTSDEVVGVTIVGRAD